MKLTACEIYTIVNALQSRLEWMNEFPTECPFDEKPHTESAMKKLRNLSINIGDMTNTHND